MAKKYNLRLKNRFVTVSFLFFIFILSALLAFIISDQFKLNKSSDITGPLHTKGNNIYDRNNNKVVIRGINYDELVPIGYEYKRPDLTNLPIMCQIWNEPPTKLNAQQVKNWGFNSIRVPINWHSLEIKPPTIDKKGVWQHSWDINYLTALDGLIADISNQGLAVILDMHQYLWSPAFKYIQSIDGVGCSGSGFPEWLYPDTRFITFQAARCDFFKSIRYDQSPVDPQETFIEVWKFIINRYQDNPQVVAADIINEPWSAQNFCNPKDLNLNNFYEKLGKIIRSVNPDILLIYEDSQDNEADDFALTKPLTLPNSVYSFHLYTVNWIPDGKNRLDKFYDRAKLWQVPLFVGEFDGFGKAVNNNLDDSSWQNQLELMMVYLKERQISWTFWSYSGYYSLLIPGTYNPKADLLSTLQKGL